MDACHMLLGRPWQFNRKTIHTRQDNTYAFYKNNKKIILAPMGYEVQLTQTKNKNHSLLFVPKKSLNVSDAMLELVKSLLSKF